MSVVTGELSVIVSGIILMLLLSVDNWGIPIMVCDIIVMCIINMKLSRDFLLAILYIQTQLLSIC